MTNDLDLYVVEEHLIATLSSAGNKLVQDRQVCFVYFNSGDLANPDSDVVGVYYHTGCRIYLWRDLYWLEWCGSDLGVYIEHADTAALARFLELSRILPRPRRSMKTNILYGHCSILIHASKRQPFSDTI